MAIGIQATAQMVQDPTDCHGETDKVQLQCNEHVDYLFHRLLALFRLLLSATNRDG
jgi:hypothetical protein